MRQLKIDEYAENEQVSESFLKYFKTSGVIYGTICDNLGRFFKLFLGFHFEWFRV